jgi:hypothetical protein
MNLSSSQVEIARQRVLVPIAERKARQGKGLTFSWIAEERERGRKLPRVAVSVALVAEAEGSLCGCH